MRELGRHATQRVRIYLTGGATAVLEGWRTSGRAGERRARRAARLHPRAARLEGAQAIEPELFRYPAIDPGAFRARVEAFMRSG